MQALINFGNKVNTMILAYILGLDFKVCQTNVEAQKINEFTFEIFKIVSASLQVEDKLKMA